MLWEERGGTQYGFGHGEFGVPVESLHRNIRWRSKGWEKAWGAKRVRRVRR